MKEQQQDNNIVWPEPGVVNIGENIDFAYIMRKDGVYTMSPIAAKFANEYGMDESQALQVFLEEYDTFFAKTADYLLEGFSQKGNVSLHLFDQSLLDKAGREKAQGFPIVSLDPLINQGVIEHKVSRGYYVGGTKAFGQVARPGSDPLSLQASEVKEQLGHNKTVIVEDDIFSGGSVIASLQELMMQDIDVEKIVSGIQVGKPQELAQMGIAIDPVVTYESENADIFDKVDLGDPRDFLLGASGLVIELPDGTFGRAPYVIPFVSPAARAGIPKEDERNFSLQILQASFDFFDAVEEKIGKPVLLKHMDPHFTAYMYTLFGIDHNTSMKQIASFLSENIDTLWESTQKTGEIQEALAQLQLPEKMILLDVNGTLIPDDSPDGKIPEESLERTRKLLALLDSLGISVGLCSDSPLPQLIQYSNYIGLQGPIIAENGSILHYNGISYIYSEFEDLNNIKKTVQEISESHSFEKRPDAVAQEFGGEMIDDTKFSWAFGANREASITLFGHSKILQTIAGSLKDTGISIDDSPLYPNSIVIHKSTYHGMKSKLLNAIATFGYGVLMVGNSKSDMIVGDKVKTAFVGNAELDEYSRSKAVHIASETYSEGVNEILEKVVSESSQFPIERVRKLHLPAKMVLMDVDGTLIEDDGMTADFSEEEITDFKQLCHKLLEQGILVGLCSDSPVPQLQKLAETLEIEGPIIAENGNIVVDTFGNEYVLHTVDDIKQVKEKITFAAEQLGVSQIDDTVSGAFNGITQTFEDTFAFGANRKTSISIFADKKFIEALGDISFGDGICVGSYPEFNYFSIHPGKNQEENKALTLMTLAYLGHDIHMVGNGLSDWTPQESGVKTSFVGNAEIPQEISGKSYYVANNRTFQGVLEILQKIASEYEKK